MRRILLLLLVLASAAAAVEIVKPVKKEKKPPESYRTCTQDSECVYVTFQCCSTGTINEKFKTKWMETQTQECGACLAQIDPKRYRSYPACVKKLCEFVPVKSAADCSKTAMPDDCLKRFKLKKKP